MKSDIVEKLIVSLIGILLFCLLFISNCSQSGTISLPDPVEIPSKLQSATCNQQSTINNQQSPTSHLVSYNGRYFSYSRKFADRNPQHLQAAERIGLGHGPANRQEAAKMRDQLREISTNSYYVVEDLTHSLPYLVPTAANRLDSIGHEFAAILERNDLPQYRFRVTSVLRSSEDIRRLQRCNHNSISNSPHNYGTTFDIGYAHFDKVTQTADSMTDENLKLVLAQALLNQQREGHIYVKYEYKQGCFHITARN